MMGTKVYTMTECDRCGRTDRRDGAEGGWTAEGWCVVTVAVRGIGRKFGEDWSRQGSRTEHTLCPDCARVVIASMAPELIKK